MSTAIEWADHSFRWEFGEQIPKATLSFLNLIPVRLVLEGPNPQCLDPVIGLQCLHRLRIDLTAFTAISYALLQEAIVSARNLRGFHLYIGKSSLQMPVF